MKKSSFQSDTIPEASGVYQFIGNNQVILYVGRAVNLRRRVSQYFQKRADARITEMVSLARDIRVLETPTLFEAIILEANLIKKYQPKYNIREKDNRSFAYLVVPRRVPYPQPFIIRERELQLRLRGKGSVRVFGPFQGMRELRELMSIIRRALPVSMGRCVPESGKPCFDYQIGLCPGICIGKIPPQEYQRAVRNLIMLLEGNKQRVLTALRKQNPTQAKALEHLQDVTLLPYLTSREIVPGFPFPRVEAYDISHFGGKNTYGAMTVLEYGALARAQYRLFTIKQAPHNDDLRALQEMLERRFRHKEWPYPDLIVVDGGIPQVRHMYGLLRSLKITIPLVGISKLHADRFVFAPGVLPSVRKGAKAARMALLGLRDEAHRFGNRGRRRSPWYNSRI